MFAHLARWQRILVSGPQRAGTTIAAAMIAHDTGYRFAPEEAFGTEDTNRLRTLVRAGSSIVVQCPAVLHALPEIVLDVPSVLVVLMRRDVADIIQSQQRIGWKHEPEELAKYGLGPNAGPVARRKYEWWADNQHRLPATLEVEYDHLSAHPLWVDAEQRKQFGARQIA